MAGMDLHSLYEPQDRSILILQDTHRSEDVYKGDVDSIITIRHGCTPFWSFNEGLVQLHRRVVHALYIMGFYGVVRCGSMDIDYHLITALVERWRSETHTFHLPIGEATVTLQDVAIIWGLPVEGHPVIARDLGRTNLEWMEYCGEYLGFIPTSGQMRGRSHILSSALREHFAQILIHRLVPSVVDETKTPGLCSHTVE
ncbi:hypothetical protein DH2020_023263 [Rehmannia glutinosa]|uniref:Aminotransferase-like plant mobile domain-containing protein n=1 Tax=Rehmannia glutinosa TaxID=99300 RepID=A0ABR0W9P4_REHGL